MRDISFRSRVQVPEAVLVNELAGEAVLLDLEGQSYFGLDEVGTRMWQLITTEESLESALAVLVEEYDAEPSVLRDDLARFVNHLIERGLVALVSP